MLTKEEIKDAKRNFTHKGKIDGLAKSWSYLSKKEQRELGLRCLFEKGVYYSLWKMPQLSQYLDEFLRRRSLTPDHLKELGRLFQYGKKFHRPNARFSVNENKQKALTCYKRELKNLDAIVCDEDRLRFVEQKKSDCICSIGLVYAELGDTDRAKEWLERGIQYDASCHFGGHCNSWLAMGDAYRNGVGFETNPKKAIECYMNAGDAGLRAMGEMYLFGEMGDPDPVKAMGCFDRITDDGWIPVPYYGYWAIKEGRLRDAFFNSLCGLTELEVDYEYGTGEEKRLNAKFFDPFSLDIGILYSRGFEDDDAGYLAERPFLIGIYPSLVESGVLRNNRLVVPSQPRKAFAILKNSYRSLPKKTLWMIKKQNEFWRNVIVEEGKKLPKPYCDWFKDK